jgi:hypothetical protein
MRRIHQLAVGSLSLCRKLHSLGYGDVVMSTSWRLLGPIEATNGMLLFGVCTAMIFAVTQRLLEGRFADLKD